MTTITEPGDRLSTAAARYRADGDPLTALKLEAVLARLDARRPVRAVDLEAVLDLASVKLDDDDY